MSTVPLSATNHLQEHEVKGKRQIQPTPTSSLLAGFLLLGSLGLVLLSGLGSALGARVTRALGRVVGVVRHDGVLLASDEVENDV